LRSDLELPRIAWMTGGRSASKASSAGSVIQSSASIRKKSQQPLPQVGRGGHSSISASVAENAKAFGDYVAQNQYRELTKGLISSMFFDAVIGVVIAFNAIVIGLELELEVQGIDTGVIVVLENIFLCIYIMEIGARIYANGYQALFDRWVQFDSLLVLLGVLTNWILTPSLGEGSTDSLGPLMTLRMARLLRLAKTARLFRRFKEFWILVRGFMQSFGMIVWTLVILLLTNYVFSCVCMELITKHKLCEEDEVFRDHVRDHFRNLGLTMLTLMRFATLDNMSDVYMPLVTRDPWLAPLFVGYTLVVSLVFFHLIGAVLVSSTMEQNLEEDETLKQTDLDDWYKLVNDLKELFQKLDSDGSGNLSAAEFMRIHPNDMRTLSRALGANKSPAAVFHALDVDHSGEVSIKEFWDGIWDLISLQNGLDVKRMEKQVEIMHFRLKDIQDGTASQLRDMSRELETLRKVVEEGQAQYSPGEGAKPSKDVDAKVLKKLQHVWTESLRTALGELSASPARSSDGTLSAAKSISSTKPGK